MWHIDVNDKLKPFGLCVHGAIDGYCQKILWLEVSPSNKNPRIFARYYLNHCKEISGIARKVREDRGTENVYLAGVHYFLRAEHNDSLAGYHNFVYAKYLSDQRIEAWWSQLKRSSLS